MGGVPLFLSSPPIYFFKALNGVEKKENYKRIEREVKEHENRHFFVGGSFVGIPTYIYLMGKDGRLHPVMGEVSVDLSEEKDPLLTAQKMESILAAALDVGDISTQDAIVAGIAATKLAKAEEELLKQRAEKTYKQLL